MLQFVDLLRDLAAVEAARSGWLKRRRFAAFSFGVGLKEVFLSALFESERPREVVQAKKTRFSRAQNFEA